MELKIVLFRIFIKERKLEDLLVQAQDILKDPRLEEAI